MLSKDSATTSQPTKGNDMSLAVGISGGYACGKSFVSAEFVKLGAALVDCDVVSREVVTPGSEGLRRVVETFGESVITPGGELDRKALGDIVFADETRRRKLESILHPLIREKVMVKAHKIRSLKKDAVVLIDAALLFENGLYRLMDKNILVVCPLETQLRRGIDRDGITEEKASQRINAQWPPEKKMELADYIIDNGGEEKDTMRQVTRVWGEILKCAGGETGRLA